MKAREAFVTFTVVFVIAFAVSAGVTFIWSGFVHRVFIADWETATRMGVIFGLMVPLLQARERRQRERHI